jgi:hypothetical protein
VVADGGSGPFVLAPLAQGVTTAVGALSAARPGGERRTGAALSMAREQLPGGAEQTRVLLLYTGAADAGGESAAELAGRLRADGVLLAVVATGADQRYWSQATAATGGVLVTARGPATRGAFDQVAGLLRERYVLRFPRPERLPAAMRLSVGLETGTATVAVTVPAGPAAAPTATPPAAARPDPPASGRPWWLFTVLLLAALAGIAHLMLHRRAAPAAAPLPPPSPPAPRPAAPPPTGPLPRRVPRHPSDHTPDRPGHPAPDPAPRPDAAPRSTTDHPAGSGNRPTTASPAGRGAGIAGQIAAEFPVGSGLRSAARVTPVVGRPAGGPPVQPPFPPLPHPGPAADDATTAPTRTGTVSPGGASDPGTSGSGGGPGSSGGPGSGGEPGSGEGSGGTSYRALDDEVARVAREVAAGRLDRGAGAARIALAAPGRTDLVDRLLEAERRLAGARLDAAVPSDTVLDLLAVARRVTAGERALVAPSGVRVEHRDGVLRVTGPDGIVRECRTAAELARHVDPETLTPEE